MEYRYAPAGLHPVAVPILIKSLVNVEENRGKPMRLNACFGLLCH